jgi:hypothetical protein
MAGQVVAKLRLPSIRCDPAMHQVVCNLDLRGAHANADAFEPHAPMVWLPPLSAPAPDWAPARSPTSVW